MAVRDDPRLLIRLPVQVKAWLAATATLNRRSMSREIEHRLVSAMAAEKVDASEPAVVKEP